VVDTMMTEEALIVMMTGQDHPTGVYWSAQTCIKYMLKLFIS